MLLITEETLRKFKRVLIARFLQASDDLFLLNEFSSDADLLSYVVEIVLKKNWGFKLCSGYGMCESFVFCN
jgi:hypothetical protein